MTTKPFLKWAGGKRWLVDREPIIPAGFAGKYIEPFLGGGAVFFANAPRAALLSDANARLIETYVCLRDECSEVVRLLEAHHEAHNKQHYYEIRSRVFDTAAERAAQFIYLNRACWNGLYRVNLAGQFNVPIGSKNWILSESDDFSKISNTLQGIEIMCCDFRQSVATAKHGDLIFLDPPYTVAHNNNGFVKYNEAIFSWEDQVALAEAVKQAAARGAWIVMTNADHTSIADLYTGFGRSNVISRASVISGKSSGRGATTELIIRFGGD